MKTTASPSRRFLWTLMAAGVFVFSGCDRNTAPPQQPTTHVIELTRGDNSADSVNRTSAAVDTPKLPYGAAAPMAPGTDGARVAALPTGLDQPPLPTGTPEALVNNTPTGAGMPATQTPAPSVALSATEMAFLTQATEAGLFDLRMGQLGVERASHSAVKSYAAMLVTDQATLNSGLQQLARQLNVPLPASLSEPKQQLVDNLARTGTLDFDQRFVNAVGSRDHAATIELFERTGRETRHPLVRSFVFNTLPMLRAHLTAAERLPVKG
ncbi:MAG: DUF4142 domain-containing protein [Aquabacterium sp.]